MTGQEAVNFIHERAWTGRKPGLSKGTEKVRSTWVGLAFLAQKR